MDSMDVRQSFTQDQVYMPDRARDRSPDAATALSAICNSGLSVALIDGNKFSQECLLKAFDGLYPNLQFHPYFLVENFVAAQRSDVGLILYHSHLMDLTQPLATSNIVDVRAAYPNVPLIVLSDAVDAQQPKTIRKLLEAGALGVIPTKTTGFSMSLAVIRFVQAGGTFVPPDMLMTSPSERAPAEIEPPDVNRLTARQSAVLGLLGRGKANKLIAYELGMSESTVKVHVRNIMRKMNATNRTQAVYKARRLWSNEEPAAFAEA